MNSHQLPHDSAPKNNDQDIKCDFDCNTQFIHPFAHSLCSSLCRPLPPWRKEGWVPATTKKLVKLDQHTGLVYKHFLRYVVRNCFKIGILKYVIHLWHCRIYHLVKLVSFAFSLLPPCPFLFPSHPPFQPFQLIANATTLKHFAFIYFASFSGYFLGVPSRFQSP